MIEPRNVASTRGRSVGRGQRDPFRIDASGTGWMTAGKCAQTPGRADKWFELTDERDRVSDEQHAIHASDARALCKGCPIIERCGLYAIEHDIKHGVWGGMTPYMRARVGARKLATARDAEAS